jgi:two-component system response regulator CssR
MRILYLEDQPSDADLVARYVETTHHKLVTVDSIEAAWEALEEPIDVIMMDIVIRGDRSGFTFAEALHEQGNDRPLVAITALNTPGDMRRCRELGFDPILQKPFTIDQLADVLDQFIG